MDAGTIVNAFIAVVLFLAGALMTFGTIIMKSMQNSINEMQKEMLRVRERLHKVEGSSASLLTHVEMVNKSIDVIRTMDNRVTQLETARVRR